MNTRWKIMGLAAAAVFVLAGAGRAAELHVGVYQPNGQAAATLPELLKPWALAAGIRVTPLRPEDLRAGRFQNVDVIVVADADSHTTVLNPDGDEKRALQAFVHGGGGYVGICAGCVLALDSNTGLGFLPMKQASTAGLKRGPQPVKLQMTRLAQTVLADDRKFADAAFEGGPLLETGKVKQSKLARRYNLVGMFWEASDAGTARKNPLAFAPAIVTTEFGSGRVVGFCIHPERTPGLEGWLPSALRWASGKTR